MANLLDLLKFIDQMKQHEASLAAAPAQTADGKPAPSAAPPGQTADTTSPVTPPGMHPVVAQFLRNMSKGQGTGDALKSAIMKGA